MGGKCLLLGLYLQYWCLGRTKKIQPISIMFPLSTAVIWNHHDRLYLISVIQLAIQSSTISIDCPACCFGKTSNNTYSYALHLEVYLEDGIYYGTLTLGSNTMTKGALVVCISRLLGTILSLVSGNLDVTGNINSHLWLNKRTPSISWHNARNYKMPWTHIENWVVVIFLL